MTEHQADLLTIMAVAIVFPLIGFGKLVFSQIMRRNTTIRTRIGDWLVKMFIAVGVTFILFGTLYALSLAISYEWLTLPLWARWIVRIGAVMTGVLSLVATVKLYRALKPLLKSPTLFDLDQEQKP